MLALTQSKIHCILPSYLVLPAVYMRWMVTVALRRLLNVCHSYSIFVPFHSSQCYLFIEHPTPVRDGLAASRCRGHICLHLTLSIRATCVEQRLPFSVFLFQQLYHCLGDMVCAGFSWGRRIPWAYLARQLNYPPESNGQAHTDRHIPPLTKGKLNFLNFLAFP